MPIVVNLDVVMAMRKISSIELAERIGISQANLSILKTGKARAVRFSTLAALCEVLVCQPGDILEYRWEDNSAAYGEENLDEIYTDGEQAGTEEHTISNIFDILDE